MIAAKKYIKKYNTNDIKIVTKLFKTNNLAKNFKNKHINTDKPKTFNNNLIGINFLNSIRRSLEIILRKNNVLVILIKTNRNTKIKGLFK